MATVTWTSPVLTNLQTGGPVPHPGGNPGANLKSISHRCYLFEEAFVWDLTQETIYLPLGCLQGEVQKGARGPFNSVQNGMSRMRLRV